MHDAIHAPIAPDVVHARALLFRDLLRGLNIQHITFSIVKRHRFGFEQGDGEAAGLEDGNDLLHDVGGFAAGLAARDVGFKTGVGAMGFRGHVDGEIVCSVGSGWSGDDAVGTETAWSEEEGVNATVRVFGRWVDGGEPGSFGYDGAKGVAFCC